MGFNDKLIQTAEIRKMRVDRLSKNAKPAFENYLDSISGLFTDLKRAGKRRHNTLGRLDTLLNIDMSTYMPSCYAEGEYLPDDLWRDRNKVDLRLQTFQKYFIDNDDAD